MHLMVYAAYGRAGIYMLQEYCRRLGIGHTDQEIQDLAVTLTALPHTIPWRACWVSRRIFTAKPGLPTRCSTPRIALTRCRSFLILSKTVG